MTQASLFLFVAFLLGDLAFGGIGAGNGFEHRINENFDFHMAHPGDWAFDEGRRNERQCSGGESCTTWLTSNVPLISDPVEQSFAKVTFVLGSEIEDMAQLRAYVEVHHPALDWSDLEEGDFLGLRASWREDEHSASTIDYYLVDKFQIIRIDWRSHDRWKNQIDAIMQSVDRATSEGKVQKIFSDPGPLSPGDTGCIYIEVDDLRNEFEKDDLKIQFKGQPRHYAFNKIDWIPEKNWYRVCASITTAFGSDGLRPIAFEIGDSGAIECRDRNGSFLECMKCVTDGRVRRCEYKPADATVQIASVSNPDIDREGPRLLKVEFDYSQNKLILDAEDESGIIGAELFTDREQRYPITGSKSSVFKREIDGDRLFLNGWNTIKAIVVFDSNGFGTMLRDLGDANYWQVSMDGTTSQSTIPVINHFVGRAAQ